MQKRTSHPRFQTVSKYISTLKEINESHPNGFSSEQAMAIFEKNSVSNFVWTVMRRLNIILESGKLYKFFSAINKDTVMKILDYVHLYNSEQKIKRRAKVQSPQLKIRTIIENFTDEELLEESEKRGFNRFHIDSFTDIEIITALKNRGYTISKKEVVITEY